MSITPYAHFYEATMRRYLEQMVRAFSGFQYVTGSRNGQPPETRLVPCRMAMLDRTVASIQRNLSENTLLTAPMITIAQTGLSGRRDAVQFPGHVDTRHIVEREIVDGKYSSGRGNSYTIRRLMPRPFMMSIEVAIWTTNLDQKHQILEQICTIFYPTIDIQNSDNALDWSALTMLTMEDDIQFSSRSIPVGSENEIDVATMQFKLPIMLNPPAQLRQQKVIEQIVTNIHAATHDESGSLVDAGIVDQQIVTPSNYHVNVEGGSIQLLWSGGRTVNESGAPALWSDVFALYGPMRPMLSKLRLILGPNIETSPQVIGFIQTNPTDPTRLIWQPDPDTLPANTLRPVDAVIQPMTTFPGQGLPNDADGARYLIMQDIGPSVAWGNLTARANDIIERQNGGWIISFRAADVTVANYVLNLYSLRQLRWTGSEWIMALDGEYAPGYWRLSL